MLAEGPCPPQASSKKSEFRDTSRAKSSEYHLRMVPFVNFPDFEQATATFEQASRTASIDLRTFRRGRSEALWGEKKLNFDSF